MKLDAIVNFQLFKITQAQLLMVVHHKNLVSLIGYCKEDDNLALIYEFMSNGNLRQHLSGMGLY